MELAPYTAQRVRAAVLSDPDFVATWIQRIRALESLRHPFLETPIFDQHWVDRLTSERKYEEARRFCDEELGKCRSAPAKKTKKARRSSDSDTPTVGPYALVPASGGV